MEQGRLLAPELAAAMLDCGAGGCFVASVARHAEMRTNFSRV